MSACLYEAHAIFLGVVGVTFHIYVEIFQLILMVHILVSDGIGV